MKRKDGFSLVEIVVVGALASVLMVGIMSLFNYLNRSQRSINQSGDFSNAVLLLKMALQNPATCPAALQNASGGTIAPPASLTEAAPNFPAAGIAVSKISIGTLLVDTTAPYKGMLIQSIVLNQVVVGSPNNASPIPYTANLRLTGSKTLTGTAAAVGGGALFTDIPISLRIQVPAGGGPAAISACSTQGTVSANASSMISNFGDDKRCPGDLWIFACSDNPTMAWNYNYCLGHGHSTYYGWKLCWDAAAKGYRQGRIADCAPMGWGVVNLDVYCSNPN